MRELKCDFCNSVLSELAWDCPARDFEYHAPRVGLDQGDPVIGGSLGGWMACEGCARCVRDGRREWLLKRALMGNFGTVEIPRWLTVDLRELHDQFWENRTGPPVPMSADELAELATEPAFKERSS